MKLKPLMLRVCADPLHELTSEEKAILSKYRNFCLTVPSSLMKLAQSINWSDSTDVEDFHQLLGKWPRLPPLEAIQVTSFLSFDNFFSCFD
jgi:hypothetical protein